MKKTITALALILALLTVLSAVTAFADQAAATDPEEEKDLFVGAWRMPPSPFGDDFSCFVVLNEDGSFLNATNLYEHGNSGPHTQTVTTNETFKWIRTGDFSLELHYSYLDDNGEFITELTYNPKEDAFYFWGSLYATRDNSFVLE